MVSIYSKTGQYFPGSKGSGAGVQIMQLSNERPVASLHTLYRA